MARQPLVILLSFYLIGYTLSLRPVFRWQMRDSCCPPEWFDVGISAIMALMLGLLWPFLLVGTCIGRCIGRCDPEQFARLVGGESRQQKMERKREEIRVCRERIKHLERELLR